MASQHFLKLKHNGNFRWTITNRSIQITSQFRKLRVEGPWKM